MGPHAARIAAPICFALLISALPVNAIPVHVEVAPPSSTPSSAVLWLSGNRAELGQWNGAGVRLTRDADGRHRATLDLPVGTPLEFKVTRGSWDTVEKGATGAEIANRRWLVTGTQDTVRIEVAAWRDAFERPEARVSTIVGEVRRHPAFPSQHVVGRDVLVWLPPGYDKDTRRRYPVVVFHDGQNVFDGATSFLPGQEWRADETADRLIRERRLGPCLLVAVANTAARREEYTLEPDPRYGGGGSERYMRFVVEELLPFVDRTYRTRTTAVDRTVIGSSLGGLVSLDLALRHPGTFGHAGVISPAVWWADRAIVGRVAATGKRPVRVWLDIGTAESTPTAEGRREWMEGAQALRDALVAAGWREGADLHYEEVEGAAHNERAWAERLDRVLLFLQSRP